MRNHIKRCIVLPFFFGCASHSSVELGAPPKADSNGPIIPRREEQEEDRSIIIAKMKGSMLSSGGNLVLSKPNVAAGIQRLIRGIKSLSQLFFYKEDIEMEPEMEIGYPTDVKHVTHIGLDGSSTKNNVTGWDNLNTPELLSLSPISFNQFELNMAPQAHQSLINDPSSRYG